MIVSDQWLREWVALRLQVSELVDLLTHSGLEASMSGSAGPTLAQVVVGEVDAIEAVGGDTAPLARCTVSAGRGRRHSVICGAPNVRVGGRYALALPGATLSGGRVVESARVRGFDSDGMLCSAAELGLGDDAGVLFELDGSVTPGRRLDDALGLDDALLNVEITPNRGDCLSIAGLAREIAILTGAKFRPRATPAVPAAVRRAPKIALQAPSLCPRYAGRIIEGIDPAARTPLWIRERLRRAGLRAISPVVDITNYVMLELGQPMHGFDLDRLQGGISVRPARAGETLVLLDDHELELDTGSLLICDDSGPVALAGIMGGRDTAIGAQTRNVLLEAAHFTPAAVAGRARHYGIQTESAQRFERGVDPSLPPRAMERASELLIAVAGGRAGPLVDRKAARHLPGRRAVTLRRARLARLLGANLPGARVTAILKRLAGRVGGGRDGWRVAVPVHRFDLARECDLVEEVARVHGYARLPSRLAAVSTRARVRSDRDADERRLRTVLVDRGYQEVITYSFVDPRLQELLEPHHGALRLANPIAATMAVMRTGLWPGLLQAVAHNYNRQHRRIRVFEMARAYLAGAAGHHEPRRFAGAITGTVLPEQWASPSREVDFFDARGDVEALLGVTRREQAVSFHAIDEAPLHPGQAAEIRLGDRRIGRVGCLHPRVTGELGIEQPVFAFEIDLDPVRSGLPASYRAVSRQPAIRRDIAIVVKDSIPAQFVLDTVREAAGPILVGLELFDVYRGEGIGADRRSLAIALTLQDSSRTLTEGEVSQAVSDVLSALRTRHDAELRV